MNRRRFFIGSVAAAGLVQPSAARKSEVEVGIRGPANSYQKRCLRDIEPGHDEFPLEKEAFEIASRLKRFDGDCARFPFAPGPARHLAAVRPLHAHCGGGRIHRRNTTLLPSDIAEGLVKWLDSLGKIRAIRFYVLPDNLIRFEIASRQPIPRRPLEAEMGRRSD